MFYLNETQNTKILLPVDLNIDKNRIVKGLALLANFKNPELTIFHAIELPVTATLDINEYKPKVDEIRSKLKSFIDWLKKQPFKINERIVVARHIADAIVEEANSGNYDIVLLTKRKPRKGFRKLFYRSHSDYVTGLVNCPTLILVRKN